MIACAAHFKLCRSKPAGSRRLRVDSSVQVAIATNGLQFAAASEVCGAQLRGHAESNPPVSTVVASSSVPPQKKEDSVIRATMKA